MTAYHYYPGCSLKGTGRAYEESFLTLCQALRMDVTEIDDWNCCGATAYMSTDELEATALAARNLALAEREPHDVITPCSACYLVLNKAIRRMKEDETVRKQVGGALESVGLPVPETVWVRHPLDVLVNDVGIDTIKRAVPPGTVVTFSLKDHDPAPGISPHGLELFDAYRLARALDLPVATHLDFVAVEISDTRTMGADLTTAVAQAIPEMIARVHSIL